MVVVLSPAPTTPVATQTARDYLSPLIGVTGEVRLDQLIAVAAAVIEKEAPAAPQAIKNEAAVRFCGYLAQARPGAVRSHQLAESYRQEFVVNHGPAFRNCGAKSMLSPFVVRRAGSVG